MVIPALTEDRRKELVKDVKKIAENGKIALRNIRQDANSDMKKRKLPEDVEKSVNEDVQELINKYNKIIEEKLKEKEEAEGEERRSKIGTGDRSEKIRTYNYPQNRLTDHRIGFTSMNLDRIMDGELEVVIEALINEDQKRKLEGSV